MTNLQIDMCQGSYMQYSAEWTGKTKFYVQNYDIKSYDIKCINTLLTHINTRIKAFISPLPTCLRNHNHPSAPNTVSVSNKYHYNENVAC